MLTNLAIAVIAGVLIWFVGIGTFLLVHLPITLLAASAGVWLFYVQHQFEETFWARGEEWDRHEATLQGSSHYVLPGVLRWFTANIGVHHVHHLCSGIPYYRLPRVLRDHPDLSRMNRLTLLQSLRSVRLVLWDEARAAWCRSARRAPPDALASSLRRRPMRKALPDKNVSRRSGAPVVAAQLGARQRRYRNRHEREAVLELRAAPSKVTAIRASGLRSGSTPEATSW